MFLIGYILMCVFVYALLYPQVTGHAGILEVDLILAGFGVMFAFPMIFYIIAVSYPPQIVGKMSGLWCGIGSFGGVTGLYIAGLTIKSQGSYHTTLRLQSLAALLGFALTFVLIRLQKRLKKA